MKSYLSFVGKNHAKSQWFLVNNQDSMESTLPETNITVCTWKNDGWNTLSFSFGARQIFRCFFDVSVKECRWIQTDYLDVTYKTYTVPGWLDVLIFLIWDVTLMNNPFFWVVFEVGLSGAKGIWSTRISQKLNFPLFLFFSDLRCLTFETTRRINDLPLNWPTNFFVLFSTFA